jgi:TonB family protein
MKALLTFLLLSCVFISTAQTRETFYDANWKPCNELEARFLSYVMKTDSGWLQSDYYIATKKLQMQALYADEKCSIKNGQATWFHANGTVATWTTYKNNQLHGLYFRFHSNGMMRDSAFFVNCKQKGTRLGWHRNGTMSDSSTFINDSTATSISWFENGNISSAGYLINGEKHARWKYFHHTGNLACIEVYNKGKQTEVQYYDRDGNTEKIGIPEAEAEFKGGSKAFSKKVESKLYWPTGLQFSKGNMAVVVVDLFIDEEGKVAHAEVTVPMHPEFDKIALNAVKNAGNWIPAVSKNRTVSFWARQNVRFSQPD